MGLAAPELRERTVYFAACCCRLALLFWIAATRLSSRTPIISCQPVRTGRLFPIERLSERPSVTASWPALASGDCGKGRKGDCLACDLSDLPSPVVGREERQLGTRPSYCTKRYRHEKLWSLKLLLPTESLLYATITVGHSYYIGQQRFRCPCKCSCILLSHIIRTAA